MRVLMYAALTAIIFPAMTASAEARWTCGARSYTGGWGVGWAPSRNRAARIALRNCAVNTPRGYYCRIVRCRRG
jgi:hypothetical protein